MKQCDLSSRKVAQLRREIADIQVYLDRFEPTANRERRIAQLGKTAEFLVVKNFPLPDRYRPDCIDLLVLLDDYPARPPIGLYVLNKHNDVLIRQLSDRFNAFRDEAFHEAPAIQAYSWICYTYSGNRWRYRADNPARGDNVRKFLASFFAELNT